MSPTKRFLGRGGNPITRAFQGMLHFLAVILFTAGISGSAYGAPGDPGEPPNLPGNLPGPYSDDPDETKPVSPWPTIPPGSGADNPATVSVTSGEALLNAGFGNVIVTTNGTDALIYNGNRLYLNSTTHSGIDSVVGGGAYDATNLGSGYGDHSDEESKENQVWITTGVTIGQGTLGGVFPPDLSDPPNLISSL
jgi:hypothetical protein